jgi:hypothetical protein
MSRAGAVPSGGARCEGCGAAAVAIHRATDDGAWLCECCFTARPATDEAVAPPPASPLSSETGSPRSSFLVPCPTEAPPSRENGELGEVEQLLLEYAAGRWAGVRVVLPPLPVSATPAMCGVAEFFALVLGMRRSVGLPEEVPCAVRWVGRHVGLPRASVSRALAALVAHGVLVRAEPLKALRYPRGTQCYRAGDFVATQPDDLSERRRRRPHRAEGRGRA